MTSISQVTGSWLEAGYEYIMMDDCWLSHQRTEEGRLQPDPERFPSGLPALVNYCHKLGLKFGIYEVLRFIIMTLNIREYLQDYGTKTCAGYPGSLGHLETDAK